MKWTLALVVIFSTQTAVAQNWGDVAGAFSQGMVNRMQQNQGTANLEAAMEAQRQQNIERQRQDWYDDMTQRAIITDRNKEAQGRLYAPIVPPPYQAPAFQGPTLVKPYGGR